jgi:tRNA-Thr(GGU) m(6)t(6)A37 methyltransferase TsaA
MFTPKAIGFVHSPYSRTTDVPRGLGAKHEAVGTLEILREYEPGLLDIEGFSHLFVIWVFDRSETVELTGPSPMDQKVHGVFSSRSPFRPNPIALTVVELIGREGTTLNVKGVDMLDGTPILDIKPYMSGVPAEKLRRGWADAAEAEKPRGA